AQDLGQRVHQQGLGEPGNPENQRVAADEERHEELLDYLVLPDDRLAELHQYPVAPLLEPVRQLEVVVVLEYRGIGHFRQSELPFWWWLDGARVSVFSCAGLKRQSFPRSFRHSRDRGNPEAGPAPRVRGKVGPPRVGPTARP